MELSDHFVKRLRASLRAAVTRFPLWSAANTITARLPCKMEGAVCVGSAAFCRQTPNVSIATYIEWFVFKAHFSTCIFCTATHELASLRTREQLVRATAAGACTAVLLCIAWHTSTLLPTAEVTPMRTATITALLTFRGTALLVGAARIDSATHFVVSAITSATASGVALLHRWIRRLPENATHVRASNSDEATFISPACSP